MSDTIIYVYMLWRSIVRGKIDWVSNVARSNVRRPNVPRPNGGSQMSWTRRHRYLSATSSHMKRQQHTTL